MDVEFAGWLKRHQQRFQRIVALTGAGISAESGVPTFRGPDGWWRGMDPTQFFTPEALSTNPRLTWQMYDELRVRIARAQPNAGHQALAELAQTRQVTVVTQNIDGLHQRAQSSGVLELHGSLWHLRCAGCGYQEENVATPLPSVPPLCPRCARVLRPDIVLFSEALPIEVYATALAAVKTCDLLLVIGTSGVVYPAAGLPAIAHEHGAVVVEVNPQETTLSAQMDYSLRGAAAFMLSRVVEVLGGV